MNLISCEREAPDPRKSQFYLSTVFGDQTSFRAKGLRWTRENRNFTSVFDDRTSFRAKGLRGTPGNRNFPLVFCDRTSFRAKGLSRHTQNRNFISVFGDRTSFGAKIAISLQFLAIEARFVRKSCRQGCKLAISLQFLAIEARFVRKGCVSCRLVGTAPCLKREIDKKEKEGQESKRARENVKMRRCEDVM